MGCRIVYSCYASGSRELVSVSPVMVLPEEHLKIKFISPTMVEVLIRKWTGFAEIEKKVQEYVASR